MSSVLKILPNIYMRKGRKVKVAFDLIWLHLKTKFEQQLISAVIVKMYVCTNRFMVLWLHIL